MKHISFLLLLFSIFLAGVNFAMADDFYYSGSPSYNPYNGYTVMSLPPPPPMSSVPFYVRDDYDDYIEDYYKCILGYEYKGLTCRYWRNYAEKMVFIKKLHQFRAVILKIICRIIVILNQIIIKILSKLTVLRMCLSHIPLSIKFYSC